MKTLVIVLLAVTIFVCGMLVQTGQQQIAEMQGSLNLVEETVAQLEAERKVDPNKVSMVKNPFTPGIDKVPNPF